MTFAFPERIATRPLWLVTLADLALLLVGFFVLLQASKVAPVRLAHGVRAGFAAEAPPLPVSATRIDGFAAGSAALPATAAALTGWAEAQLADPRVSLTVTGGAGQAPGDVDRATGSATLLAIDRARAVAALIAPIAPARVAVATARGPAAVTITIAFTGERTPS